MKLQLTAMLLASALLGNAQNQLPIKKVTLFKNATALVVKEGNVNINDGKALLPIPDQARFGSYFLGTAKDNAVKSIVFKNDTIKKQERSTAVWQFIAGNLNKPVVIYYTPTQGIDKSASGKVTGYDLSAGMVKFVTDAGRTLVMHVNSIYQAEFKEDPAQFYMADSIKRMAVISPEKSASSLSLQEVYMTAGLNWLPSYYLRLKDDKNARIEMKAIVENVAEDIKDADMELVVGAPQMKYSGTPDPMTYDYITTGGGAAGGAYLQRNYMQSNAMQGYAKLEAADEGQYFESSYATEGEKNDDQYIYKLGKVTLGKKSKGTFPIFAGNAEYKHKYEGTIPDISNYFNTRYIPQEERMFDIFHSLEVKNTSSVPFTTAAIMVVNEKDQLIAQDELKYTPVGATGDIRLSKAIDIVMKNSEEEKNREDNAKKIGKTNYSKVSVKGTVNIANYQNKEVTVVITKNINGAVTASSDGAKIIKNNPFSSINPSSDVKWEVKLGANEKKTLTYDYDVFFIP